MPNLAHLVTLWGDRLAIFAGVVVTYLIANPGQMDALLSLLPEGPWRILAGVAAGIVVSGIASAAGRTDVRRAKGNP